MKQLLPRQLIARQIPGDGNSGSGSSRQAKPHPDEAETERFICCRRCGQPITRVSDGIQVDGRHQHSFTNPLGHFYDIGCFVAARNLAISSDASSEFTWFAGYQWQVVVCYQCRTHLGWRFSSANHEFYGLILDRLTAGTPPDPSSAA